MSSMGGGKQVDVKVNIPNFTTLRALRNEPVECKYCGGLRAQSLINCKNCGAPR